MTPRILIAFAILIGLSGVFGGIAMLKAGLDQRERDIRRPVEKSVIGGTSPSVKKTPERD